MRKLIITDLHKKDPREFIESRIRQHFVDQVVCCGDIESADIYDYLLTRSERDILVPGNHDYAFMIDCSRIVQGLPVDRTQKPDYIASNLEYYWTEVEKWINNSRLRNLALGLVNNVDNEDRFLRTEETKNGKLCYVHASIFDDSELRASLLVSDDLPNENRQYALWARMHNALGAINHSVIVGNFETMKDPYVNFWMLFRGHDWGQKLYALDRKSASLGNYEAHWNPCASNLRLSLSPDKVYIACFGSFRQGQYGIFDEENGLLEFHNPERQEIWTSE